MIRGPWGQVIWVAPWAYTGWLGCARCRGGHECVGLVTLGMFGGVGASTVDLTPWAQAVMLDAVGTSGLTWCRGRKRFDLVPWTLAVWLGAGEGASVVGLVTLGLLGGVDTSVVGSAPWVQAVMFGTVGASGWAWRRGRKRFGLAPWAQAVMFGAVGASGLAWRRGRKL